MQIDKHVVNYKDIILNFKVSNPNTHTAKFVDDFFAINVE